MAYRTYKSKRSLEIAVERYFAKCMTWETVKDKAGNPVTNLLGEEMEHKVFKHAPSLAELCLELGISQRTWATYSEPSHDYAEVCEQAKARIEAYLYNELNTRSNVNGIIFNLQNNYGMADKHKIEATEQVRLSVRDKLALIREAAAMAEVEE